MGRRKVEYCVQGHGPWPVRYKTGGCKECSDSRQQDWKDIHLQSRYGISLADFNRRLEEQHGVCAICSEPETVSIKGVVPTLSIDHDHDTGKVRGLLCRRCNTLLGQFSDKIELLDSAKEYLLRNRQ